jgi:hypothetical protein
VIWWDTLLKTAADSIDFIALHRYIGVRRTHSDIHKSLRIVAPIQKLRSKIRHMTGRDLPVFVTEWNIWKENNLSQEDYRRTIDEALKDFQEAGVKFAYFWPLRTFRKPRVFRSLEDLHRPLQKGEPYVKTFHHLDNAPHGRHVFDDAAHADERVSKNRARTLQRR